MSETDRQNGIKGNATPRASWSFGGDHVMEATATLPEHQRELIRWLFFHSVENGVSRKEAAANIRYSDTVVYRVCMGSYEGDLDAVCERIAQYRKLCEQRSAIVKESFVETDTSKRIWQICDAATTYQIIAAIYGDSQIGKTYALEEYQRRNNHGQTKYIRLPAAAGVQMMIKVFAEACGLSSKSSFEALRKRVMKAIDSNTLVIVDELHQAFVTYHKHSRVACLELIREIHDRTGCGMVLCGTNVARDEIEGGQHRALLEQINRRGVFKLQLAKHASWKDRNAIARHYNLDTPQGDDRKLVDHVVTSSGLKALVTYFKAANRLASTRGEDVAWKHVTAAYSTIQSLSTKPSREVA